MTNTNIWLNVSGENQKILPKRLFAVLLSSSEQTDDSVRFCCQFCFTSIKDFTA